MVRVYRVFWKRGFICLFWLEKCVLATVEPDTEGPVLVLYPAHPQFSIGIAWIGGTVESAYTVYNTCLKYSQNIFSLISTFDLYHILGRYNSNLIRSQ